MTSQAIELPQLVLTAAPSPAEKVAALQLIANSIAQQRQTLNRAIMLHPYFLAPAFALLAVLYRSTPDLPTLVVLAAGITMALFSILSRYTSDYLTRAEDVGSAAGRAEFVDAPDRITVVARWGERVIGAVVVAVGDQKAEVWGWAVELRYRGKGLGRDLVRSLLLCCEGEGGTLTISDSSRRRSRRCARGRGRTWRLCLRTSMRVGFPIPPFIEMETKRGQIRTGARA